MFSVEVLHNVTAVKGGLGYSYYQPVSHGHIIKVGDYCCRVTWWGQHSWSLDDIVDAVRRLTLASFHSW